MSLRTLRLALALRTSVPPYLPVKEQRARRRRATLVFTGALAVTIAGRLLFGAFEVDPPPERGCVVLPGASEVVCGPIAGAEP